MIDLIDKYSQRIIIREDYANHIIWGGALGLLLAVVVGYFMALLIVLIVALLKKIYDYVAMREPFSMLIGKTVSTAIYPFLFYISHIIR